MRSDNPGALTGSGTLLGASALPKVGHCLHGMSARQSTWFSEIKAKLVAGPASPGVDKDQDRQGTLTSQETAWIFDL